MWIVNEENHSGLFVTEDIIRGITWLVNNDWLLGRNEAEDIFGNTYTLAEQIGTSNKKEIIAWFVAFLANKGMMSTLSLLEDYGIDMQQKNVVIINRSKEIGQTLFHYFLNKDCTVTVCHSKTKNLNEYIKQADIVVTAVGKANLFSLSVFKENSVVIDVGLECLDGKILGDIDVSNEEDCKISYLVKAIGGVGPMTIAALAENILKSYYLKVEDKENII